MNSFVHFMASATGRLLRIVAGAALIAWGLISMTGSNGYIVAAIGALPILTGIFNICVIAPLLGAPISGWKTRAAND